MKINSDNNKIDIFKNKNCNIIGNKFGTKDVYNITINSGSEKFLSNLINHDINVLQIDGNDISYIIKIVNICLNIGFHPEIKVFGISNIHNKDIITTIYGSKSETDLYIRSISGLTLDKDIVSIGGSNASKQEIAAQNFQIFLPNEIYTEIINEHTWIRVYNKNIDHSNIYDFIKDYPMNEEHIDTLISLLKKYPNMSLLDKLTAILLDKKFSYSDEKLSKIIESYRTLKSICFSNEKLENKIISSLEMVIYTAFEKKYYQSVINAVEAIGALQYTEKSYLSINNIIAFIINNISQWSDKKEQEHLIWCSLSMLRTSKNCIPLEYKKILKTEKFSFIPASVLNFHDI